MSSCLLDTLRKLILRLFMNALAKLLRLYICITLIVVRPE